MLNKWLERALISAGAAVVSTTAIVTTAERPGKKKRKKKKGDDSRGKDGALVDDEVPRSVGAQAAHDYRVGHDGGLTTLEWIANVRDAGKNAASRVSTVGGYLLGRQQPPPAAGDDDEALEEARAARPPKAKRKKVRRRVRRKVGEGARAPAAKPRAGAKKVRQKKGSARREEPVDEMRELRDEAVKRAASAAAKHAADKSGLGGAARQIKESSEELWKKTEQLGKAVKDRVPEDLGERASATLGEAGKGIARGARALSERLRTALSEEQAREQRDGEGESKGEGEGAEARTPDTEHATSGAAAREPTIKEPDLGDRLGRGFKGVARWMEGPGAPRDDNDPTAPRRTRTRPTASGDEAVEAKDPDAPAPDVVEAKDPDDERP